MQISFTLNNLYADYMAGLLNKKDFEASIFKTIKENVHCFGLVGWNREDSDDYISSLYPRISRAIDAYQEAGSSFETYIGSMVRLTAKEYRSRQLHGYYEETAAWIAHLPEMYVCENEIEYDEQIAAGTEASMIVKTPRQLLILILKCSNHVSADLLEKIAPRLGLEPDELNEMIDRLKQMHEKRTMDIATLHEKMNSRFYRCILYEKKLQTLMPDSAPAQRLRKKLKTGRNRLERTRRRLAHSRIDPSNSQIAQLLGLSKGTVDSVLYNLRLQGAAYPVTDPEQFQ
jgi:DNA-directed RNA polymerase specialized sigma24 family protein